MEVRINNGNQSIIADIYAAIDGYRDTKRNTFFRVNTHHAQIDFVKPALSQQDLSAKDIFSAIKNAFSPLLNPLQKLLMLVPETQRILITGKENVTSAIAIMCDLNSHFFDLSGKDDVSINSQKIFNALIDYAQNLGSGSQLQKIDFSSFQAAKKLQSVSQVYS